MGYEPWAMGFKGVALRRPIFIIARVARSPPKAAKAARSARRHRRRLQQIRRVATPLKAHTARRTAHSYSTHVARS